MAKRILIIEDEEVLADTLKRKLQNAGFEVEKAPDGEIAIQMISKNKYNLFLLDLILPNITGFDVLQYILSRKVKVPVIVLSNLGQKEDLEKVAELGVKDYFVKTSISLSEVVKKVKQKLS
jgi:DNA-binding response OmpR family regulator